jgi:hypothetical protein
MVHRQPIRKGMTGVKIFFASNQQVRQVKIFLAAVRRFLACHLRISGIQEGAAGIWHTSDADVGFAVVPMENSGLDIAPIGARRTLDGTSRLSAETTPEQTGAWVIGSAPRSAIAGTTFTGIAHSGLDQADLLRGGSRPVARRASTGKSPPHPTSAITKRTACLRHAHPRGVGDLVAQRADLD